MCAVTWLRTGADTILRNGADTSTAFPLTSGVRMTTSPHGLQREHNWLLD